MKKLRLSFLTLFLLGTGISQAQITVMHEFSNGEYPAAGLTLAGNTLYGVTYEGGANGVGYLFSINTNGAGFKDVWDFEDSGSTGNANGAYPYGCTLTYANGKLYGMTYEGGSNDEGVVFSINTNGTGYKDLCDFYDSGSNGNANGAYPYGSNLTISGNKLFGMTVYGGSKDSGAAFSININGGGYKDLWDFNNKPDIDGGGYPEGGLTLSASGTILYGAVYYGGTSREGSVFSVDTNGTHHKGLVDFDGTNGEYPVGSLLLSGSQLFGTTSEGGGYSEGSVFSVDTSGKDFKPLSDFNYANGEDPYFGSLTLLGSNLYGMTYEGGNNDGGDIFRIDSNGNGGITDLADFNANTGYYPYTVQLTPLGDDTLFGVTYEGGDIDYGTIFMFVDTNIDLAVKNIQAISGSAKLYPNPNNGRFTIQLSNENEVSIVEVYNTLGEQVKSEELKGGNNQIDLLSQSNGVYLYRVITQGGNLIGEGRLIIQK